MSPVSTHYQNQTSNVCNSNSPTSTEGQQTSLTAEQTAIRHVATRAGIEVDSSGKVTMTNVSGEAWKEYINRAKSLEG